MNILSDVIVAVARFLDIILTVLNWLIAVRALISWVSPDPFNPIVQFLNTMTEPILRPIRRWLPRLAIDISPLIAFVLIALLQLILVKALLEVARHV